MGNLKTIIFGSPSGGSSFTYEVVKEFLKKIKTDLSFCSEPSMRDPLTIWWEQFKSFKEVEDNFEIALNHYDKYSNLDLLKVNYYTRFLNQNFIKNENLIFVIRAPWQWAKSSLNSRFSENYFYWMTYENKNLGKDNFKHIIDLWIEIYNQVWNNMKNSNNNILCLNYYDYVDNYKFLEESLNNFYKPQNYITINNYTNKQLVKTNKRKSKGETIRDINPNYKGYRLDEIKNIYSNFKIKLDV
tara:strand:- start:34 stop:762 length:729 start_codon:yes stop_codon:yes gene_type:complete